MAPVRPPASAGPSPQAAPRADVPRSRLLRWQHRVGLQDQGDGRAWGCDPEDTDFDAILGTVERLRPVFDGPRAWFPVQVDGWDRLAQPGKLIVANHSGGTIIPDVWGLGFAWYDRFGADRPLHALAHEMIFSLPQTSRFFARRGILRATRSAARTILTEARRDLLVLPGGDLDTWRPWTERYTVNFAGRKGYARIALETGAPVVPLAHAGAHETLVVLSDGERIARALRLPQLFRANIFPVHLSFPYGLGIGPWPHIPPPTRLRYRIGAPVVPPRLAPGQAPTPAMVDDFDARVRQALQTELDVLREESEGLMDRLEFAVRRVGGRVVRHLRSPEQRAAR